MCSQPLSETHESMLLHTETTEQTHETASPNGTAKIVTVAKQVSRTLPICNWLVKQIVPPPNSCSWLTGVSGHKQPCLSQFLQITYRFLCIFNIKATHVTFNKTLAVNEISHVWILERRVSCRDGESGGRFDWRIRKV